MSRAIIHAPSGYKLAELVVPDGTHAAPYLIYGDVRYTLAGVQDGVAHYHYLSQIGGQ